MIIYQDTREKFPWTFQMYPDVKVVQQKVDYGDYTLEGFQDSVAIERKRNTSEIANNLTTRDKHRFHRELEVLQNFQHAYIICEFPKSDIFAFPDKSGIPKKYHKKLRVNGKYLYKTVCDMVANYDINIVYCNDSTDAEEYVYNLLKEISRPPRPPGKLAF